jgi:predicted nucleic acid-binding protein
MGEINRRPAVADAGPIIHLDALGCLDLLASFDPLEVTPPVWEETHRYRPSLTLEQLPQMRLITTFPPLPAFLRRLVQEFSLDAGEVSAIHRMAACPAARFAAESLGYRVHGTIGVIVRAIRHRQRTRAEVLTILQQIPAQSSLFIKPQLLTEIIQRVERESP